MIHKLNLFLIIGGSIKRTQVLDTCALSTQLFFWSDLRYFQARVSIGQQLHVLAQLCVRGTLVLPALLYHFISILLPDQDINSRLEMVAYEEMLEHEAAEI